MAACARGSFLTIQDLISHLEDWYNNHRHNSVQLDGSTTKKPNISGWLEFNFQGTNYKINGDTTAESVNILINLYNTGIGTNVFTIQGNKLRIASQKNADGWYCYQI